MDPLERLQKLIALASNPSTPTEEARTAAMMVVRNIVEKKVVLSLPDVPRRRVVEHPPHVAAPQPASPFDLYSIDPAILADIMFGKGTSDGWKEARAAGRPSPLDQEDWTRSRVGGRPPTPTDPPRPAPVRAAVDQKKIHAKFASRCGRCGSFVTVGQPIWWTTGRAPNCESCGPIV